MVVDLSDEKKEETSEEKEEAPAPEGKTAEDTGDREPVEPEETDKLERARKEADRLEKAHQQFAKDIEKLERLRTDEILSGKTEAGTAPQKPKEETPKEYKDRMMRGELTEEERNRR